MRRLNMIVVVAVTWLALATAVQAQRISGDYIETRNAEVWVGDCVANSELNLAGDQAILAWRVNKGAWNGVSLDGLSVVGVIKATTTLGDEYHVSNPAQAVVIVDAQASAEQQRALVDFAQSMAGLLLQNIVETKIAPIQISMGHHGMHDANTSLRAGDLVGVETRAIGTNDHLCGNENVYYRPLTKLVHAMPAVAELDRYDGPGLGVVWTLHDKRSAFVGSFAV
jgi:Protein of unknown function (DUF1326)